MWQTFTGQKARASQEPHEIPENYEGQHPDLFYCRGCGTSTKLGAHSVPDPPASGTEHDYVIEFEKGGIGLSIGGTKAAGRELVTYAVIGATDVDDDETEPIRDVNNVRFVVSPWTFDEKDGLQVAAKTGMVYKDCADMGRWRVPWTWGRISRHRGLGKIKQQICKELVVRRVKLRDRHIDKAPFDQAWKRHCKGEDKTYFEQDVDPTNLKSAGDLNCPSQVVVAIPDGTAKEAPRRVGIANDLQLPFPTL